MIILTCATGPEAKDWIHPNVEYKGVLFRHIIEATVRKAEACGYVPMVFDLGTLGIGEPYALEDPSLCEKGYYEIDALKGYQSKSLFKPALVELAMSRHADTIAYIDGDAELVGSLDDVRSHDFDIGVTLRPKWETRSRWHRENFDIVKYLNAGVVFFNPTEAARQFVARWRQVTAEVSNDQKALNRLACPPRYPRAYSVEVIDGVRVKFFPCERYNFYSFGQLYPWNARVLHYKGDVRNYYPFAWKNRVDCWCRAQVSGAMRLTSGALGER